MLWLVPVLAVAVALAVQVLWLFPRRASRHAKEQAVGDEILRQLATALGGEHSPSTARGALLAAPRFGVVHGQVDGFNCRVSILPRNSEASGGSAEISVTPPAGSTLIVTGLRYSSLGRDLPPGATVPAVFGRRRAATLPGPAHQPLLDLARDANELVVTDNSVLLDSRPRVWSWPDNSSPDTLHQLVIRVVTATQRLIADG